MDGIEVTNKHTVLNETKSLLLIWMFITLVVKKRITSMVRYFITLVVSITLVVGYYIKG